MPCNGRINLLADPALLLRQRDAARSALADVLRATYDDDLPDRIADNLRAIVLRGTRTTPLPGNERPQAPDGPNWDLE